MDVLFESPTRTTNVLISPLCHIMVLSKCIQTVHFVIVCHGQPTLTNMCHSSPKARTETGADLLTFCQDNSADLHLAVLHSVP